MYVPLTFLCRGKTTRKQAAREFFIAKARCRKAAQLLRQYTARQGSASGYIALPGLVLARPGRRKTSEVTRSLSRHATDNGSLRDEPDSVDHRRSGWTKEAEGVSKQIIVCIADRETILRNHNAAVVSCVNPTLRYRKTGRRTDHSHLRLRLASHAFSRRFSFMYFAMMLATEVRRVKLF